MTPSGGGGSGGEEGGEVEAGSLPHGAEDGRRRVGGHDQDAVGQPHGRAQVALVVCDAGVDRRSDEGAQLGRRDEERLGTRPPFGLAGLAVGVLRTAILRREEKGGRKGERRKKSLCLNSLVVSG